MFTVFIIFNRSHYDCIHKGKNEKRSLLYMTSVKDSFKQTTLYIINALMYIIAFCRIPSILNLI